MDTFVAWLGSAGWTIFAWSIVALVAIDLAALAAVARTRDRTLVNRWTGRVLAVNLALLGVGVAGPAMAFTGRMAMAVVSPLMRSAPVMQTVDKHTPNTAPQQR